MPEGYDPAFFAALAAAEDRHFWFRARSEVLSTVLEPVVADLPHGYRVIEVGCGTGSALHTLSAACSEARLIVGMDLFDEGLQYARHRARVPLVRGRMEAAPFKAAFDLVAMLDVLEHIEDDFSTLVEVRRLMTARGYFIVTVPAHKSLWSRFDEESHHCRRYELDELAQRLVEAGFLVEYLTPFMMPLYPLIRGSRWLSDRIYGTRGRLGLSQRSSVLNDLRIYPLLNDAIRLALKLELVAIRRRRRLPTGTSLLAIARRH